METVTSRLLNVTHGANVDPSVLDTLEISDYLPLSELSICEPHELSEIDWFIRNNIASPPPHVRTATGRIRHHLRKGKAHHAHYEHWIYLIVGGWLVPIKRTSDVRTSITKNEEDS